MNARMMTIQLEKIADYIPREYPLTEEGIIAYLQHDAKRDEEFRETKKLLKQLSLKTFKGEVRAKLLRWNAQVVIVQKTSPYPKVIHKLYTLYKEKYEQVTNYLDGESILESLKRGSTEMG